MLGPEGKGPRGITAARVSWMRMKLSLTTGATTRAMAMAVAMTMTWAMTTFRFRLDSRTTRERCARGDRRDDADVKRKIVRLSHGLGLPRREHICVWATTSTEHSTVHTRCRGYQLHLPGGSLVALPSRARARETAPGVGARSPNPRSVFLDDGDAVEPRDVKLLSTTNGFSISFLTLFRCPRLQKSLQDRFAPHPHVWTPDCSNLKSGSFFEVPDRRNVRRKEAIVRG